MRWNPSRIASRGSIQNSAPSSTAEPPARITQRLEVPTIGIGAGAACDGQVLVVDDMLGLFTEFRPKFVKRYAELGALADAAIADYAAEVRARTFPADEHSFPDVLKGKQS